MLFVITACIIYDIREKTRIYNECNKAHFILDM